MDRSCAQWASGDLAGALACTRQALAIDPSCVDALANAGTIMWVMGDVGEAERLYRRANAIDPAHVGVHLNMATLCNEAGDVEAALQWIARAEALRPGDRDVIWHKGLLELALGSYADGWRHYEAGLDCVSLRGKGPGFPTAPWQGARCHRLLVWHEQGLGDTVQFVRYAKLCRERAEQVLVLCPDELIALVRSCPFVDDACASVIRGDFDEHVSLMSLPHVFGTTLETIPAPVPYLFADATRAAGWAQRMPDHKPRVGLVWAGNFRKTQLRFHPIDRGRSLSLRAMRPWLAIPDIAFYSLQKGDAAGEARNSGIIDFMDEVHDLADTAAIIANLDLVISVDTSVAHVAGAMGKPVWVLSRLDACWRWLRNRPDSPWYPTARVFGQTARGDWGSVITRIGDELARL